MKNTFWKIVIISFVSSMLLFSCNQTSLNVNPIAGNEHPADLLSKLGKSLAIAKENHVDELSPTWFSKAKASYNKSKNKLKQGGKLSAIMDNIALGNAQLDQAEKYAESSRAHLKDLINSRNAAYKSRANRFKYEFTGLEDKFRNLTEAVEDNNIKKVTSEKKPLSDQYRALELRAIKIDALTEVRQMLRQAKDEDMDETAPKSYIMAKAKVDSADAFITRNRYAVDDINQRVRIAKFYIQRLKNMTQTSLRLEDMEPEDIALWMERYLHSFSVQIKGTDRRDLTFDTQQQGIIDDIIYIKENRTASSAELEAKTALIEKLNQRIADLKGRTSQERADKERLAAEKKFNELYNKVQGYFSADEAEVYKKGQELVIRLKAIQFPVGQSVIVASNYSVLKTVIKSINTFGSPDVVIEGHTDSTGSAKINKRLSQSRAESVKQYLLANGSLPGSKLAAVGYGSTRPLASNKTARGRAINRRIDVLIKPYMK